jgi:hypothetical protein
MPDDQRPVLQRRVVAFLDRGVEGIAIDVGDAEVMQLGVGRQSR